MELALRGAELEAPSSAGGDRARRAGKGENRGGGQRGALDVGLGLWLSSAVTSAAS